MRPADTVRARHRLRGGPRAMVALVAFLGLAVPVAGCGGSSSPGVANISGSSRSSGRSSSSGPGGGVARSVGFAPSPAQRAESEVVGLEFSRCMRAHGVPDFPDPPSPSGGAIRFEIGSGFDPISPLFREAERSCSPGFARRRVIAVR